ncbi:MAG: hypothetical protein OXG19_04925 [Chloroflexi bacterium]|nr:hypothetical protein [Chloroflexota bacterium]
MHWQQAIAASLIVLAIFVVGCDSGAGKNSDVTIPSVSEGQTESSQPGSLRRSDIFVACEMVTLYKEPAPVVYAVDSDGTLYPLNGNAKEVLPLANVPIREASKLVVGDAVDKHRKIESMIQDGLARCPTFPEENPEELPETNAIDASRLTLVCLDVGAELKKPGANALFAMDNIDGAIYPLNFIARQWFSLPQWSGTDDIRDISTLNRGDGDGFSQAVSDLKDEAFRSC